VIPTWFWYICFTLTISCPQMYYAFLYQFQSDCSSCLFNCKSNKWAKTLRFKNSTHMVLVIGTNKHSVEILSGVEGKICLIISFFISPSTKVSIPYYYSFIRAWIEVESTCLIFTVTTKVYTESVKKDNTMAIFLFFFSDV